MDIFQVDYITENEIVPATFTGKISFEDKSNDFTNARVQIRSNVSSVVLKELRVDEEGVFECNLTEGSYQVEFVCPNYLRVQKSISVERSTERQKIEMNVNLQVDDLLIIDDLD